MKPTPLFLAIVLAVAPLASAAVKPVSPAAPERADVTFVHPENFTDVRDGYTGTEAGRDGILQNIRDYFLKQAGRFVPAGDHLTIIVTDIDLAGDFEPWHGPNWDDVRIVKDIYPPRIDLSFRLTDGSGKVVKEGTRQLRNLAFMQTMTFAFADDPLRYEKQLIDDWYHDEFPRARRQ
ncbi:MAG TPA: DUF3016 domain-containing protein [Opitutaceae bacterium]|nr:DUF3016 domain-containing protein [Opitutaceae bacterium]